MTFNKLAIALAVAGVSTGAYATNGMIMEGYGPIATGMGGAAMAYDNGNAAMMNNPATLGLMADGNRLDLALGMIGPDVTVTGAAIGGSHDSSSKRFYMPAGGWVKKAGGLAYGIGVFAQGGMGTDYGSLGMAQVGVGRVIIPLAYTLNDKFNIGGSLDYVWGQMDLVYSSAGLNFKDGSNYTGAAKGSGIAGKIGFTYKAADNLSIGGAYHTKGGLGDLTGSGATVKNFDMPPMLALGLSYNASDKMMIAADIKDVMWSDTMNTVTIIQNGATVPFVQNWKDQTVFALGASYKFTNAFTGRIGANLANNPIPDQYLNMLWPAIVKDHYTVGFGYAVNQASDVNFSLSYAPEVTQTNPNMFGAGLAGTVKHSQTNWQLMYSYRF